MAQEGPPLPTAEQIADLIAEEGDCDVIFYNGPIQYQTAKQLIEGSLYRTRRRTNALLILVTLGGDPDAAYRIARFLQYEYKKFTFLAPGPCKSAGTLIALGAHEIAISKMGEFGPLDAQTSKRDEVFELQSGLILESALTALQEKAYQTFQDFFLQFKFGVGKNATLHTASEIAANLTTGLLGRMYEQIDPMHVGELGRSIAIAKEYGQRLQEQSQNYTIESLNHLIEEYPSHGFVIDRNEARKLFKVVRDPSPSEKLLIILLGDKASSPTSGRDATNEPRFLSKEPTPTVDSQNGGAHNAITNATDSIATTIAETPPNGQPGHGTPPGD